MSDSRTVASFTGKSRGSQAHWGTQSMVLPNAQSAPSSQSVCVIPPMSVFVAQHIDVTAVWLLDHARPITFRMFLVGVEFRREPNFAVEPPPQWRRLCNRLHPGWTILMGSSPREGMLLCSHVN